MVAFRLHLLFALFLLSGLLHAQSIEEIVVEEVSQLPYPSSCAETPDDRARGECAMRELLTRVFSNVTYPAEAINQQVQGIVQVGFVIGSTGQTGDLEIVKDIGGGCGEAAVKAVYRANQELSWNPARDGDKPVAVHLILPVQFRMAPPK